MKIEILAEVILASIAFLPSAHAFSFLCMKQHQPQQHQTLAVASRRSIFKSAAAAALGTVSTTSQRFVSPAVAAPDILRTSGGIKYAVTRPAKPVLGASLTPPLDKDIVAIEYTGYLTDGTIFDATHAEGKKNALMFEVGGNAVIDGINEMVKEMPVGSKVQAIIPPELAFGEKGICIETGECLVKPKATLVYDISLKRSTIPPP